MKMKLTAAISLASLLSACGGSGGSSSDERILDDDAPVIPLGFQLVDTYLIPGDTDCSSTMANLSVGIGVLPDETYPANGSYYDPVTQESEQVWYYWARGEGIDWVWGGNTGGCRGTVFEFTPIT